MRAIKICFECYCDTVILIEVGDVIIITGVEDCDHLQSHKEVKE